MVLNKSLLNDMAKWIVSRQSIYYNKEVLKLNRPNWYKDILFDDKNSLEIFKNYKSCNVYRQADKGSKLLTENILLNPDISFVDKFIHTYLYRNINNREYFSLLLNDVGIFKADDFDAIALSYKIKSYGQKFKFNDAYITSGANMGSKKPYFPEDIQKNFSKVDLFLAYTVDLIEREKMFHYISNIEQFLLNGNIAKAFESILDIPGCGNFIGNQILIDLLYMPELPSSDDDWTTVGPGAKETLQKMFNKQKVSVKDIYKLQGLLSNIIENNHAKTWSNIKYLDDDNKLQDQVIGISVHNIQNCCCEFRKFCHWNEMLEGKKRAKIRYYK
jgi:hypothetical protein